MFNEKANSFVQKKGYTTFSKNVIIMHLDNFHNNYKEKTSCRPALKFDLSQIYFLCLFIDVYFY